ncbi:MAG: methyltransferase domain-containing protein [Ruegeria sp.]
MDTLELIIDLHIGGDRQGPGSASSTRRAIELAGLNDKNPLQIADIGCGTGAASLILAGDLQADVTAIDLLPQFLTELNRRAEQLGLGQRITTRTASMDALPFQDAAFDVLWSEGAIYNVGFETGIQNWRKYLKPGGILAVSELTWLTQDRPDELTQHWNREYPEVALPSVKIAQLEAHGYETLGYFPLSPDCWRDEYYDPMQRRFDAFLEKNNHSGEAKALIKAEQAEMDLYERNAAYVSYGFYVARKLPD